MTIEAPFTGYRDSVRPEWIDYNGHMNVAYYVLAFDFAVDAFMDFLGLDRAYREKSGNSTFAVEAHVTYRREVLAGAPLLFESLLLAHDDKRLRQFQRMRHAEEGFLAATCEWLTLHVDLAARRVTPFPPHILARLDEVAAAHRRLPPPPEAGEAISRPPLAANAP
ncbi:MAG: thioesterase family protein [Kiloniellales bacterium]